MINRYEFTPERIKRLRIGMGMTQGQLGDLLGVGKNTISAWETGRNRAVKGPIVKALLDAEAELRASRKAEAAVHA